MGLPGAERLTVFWIGGLGNSQIHTSSKSTARCWPGISPVGGELGGQG